MSMNIPNQRLQHNLHHQHICLMNKVQGINLQHETLIISPANIIRRIEFEQCIENNEDYFGWSIACLVPI